MFKKLISRCLSLYSISPLDLADAAETNRIHTLFMSTILFVFGIFGLVVHNAIHEVEPFPYRIYFALFMAVSLLAFVIAYKTKNVAREKAYLWKTLPFYLDFCLGIGAGVYNFYILGQPFNGFITYCITGVIAVCAFSFSPLLFLFFLLAWFAVLVPGIYKNFSVTGLIDSILAVFTMFSLSLYKRRSEKKFILMLKKQKKNLEAKTFGNFTLLYENKVIKFSRTKSTELVAYLIYKNGSSVRTKELISVLWGDYADSARYGASLRNLIVDIKHSLAELEIQQFFIAEYNNFRINPEAIKCDYYDFLAGDSNAVKNFAGEFMSQYTWAEEEAGFLERKILS